MAEENKTLARGFVEGINRGRLDPELYSPDFLYHDPFGQTTDFEGADENIAMFVAGFPISTSRSRTRWPRGIGWWSAGPRAARTEATSLGMPPSGNAFTIGGLTLLRIAEGKIAEHWVGGDFLGLMQQIGAVPAPAPAG